MSLWPLERGRYPYVARGHTGSVDRVTFAPDGSWLVTYGSDGTARQWPLSATTGAAPRLLFDWGHQAETRVGRVTMSPDGYVVRVGAFPGWQTAPTW